MNYNNKTDNDALLVEDNFELIDNPIDEMFDNYVDEDDLIDDEILTTEVVKSYQLTKPKHYLPPEELLSEYHKSVEINEPTPKLIEYFFMIAENVSPLLRLKNIDDVNSCVSHAVSVCWEKKWNKFDESKSTNIFSCYTTFLLNDMRTHASYLLRHNNKKVYLSQVFID